MTFVQSKNSILNKISIHLKDLNDNISEEDLVTSEMVIYPHPSLSRNIDTLK
jgi:hypothetical protein